MPRDISGNYTLPVGNPVVSGTIIDVAWANPTMSDIATQLNGVMTRDGVLAATGPIRFTDGSASAPAVTFTGASATGFYRSGTTVGTAVAGVGRSTLSSTAAYRLIPDIAGTARLEVPTGNKLQIGVDSASSLFMDSDGLLYLGPANNSPRVGYLGVPRHFNSGGTLARTAVGRLVYDSPTVNYTLNTAVFSTGDSFWILNNSTTDAITVTPGGGFTLMYGNLVGTLSINPNSIAFIHCKSSSEAVAVVSGTVSSLDVNNPNVGSVVASDIHLGFSEASFYGYRIVNLNNPSATAAGVFSIQRGNGSSAWVDVLQSDNAGVLRIGHTSTDIYASRVNGVTVNRLGVGGVEKRHASGHSSWGINTNSGTICNFYSDNGAVQFTGSISVSGATTAYNTSSDARLKTNIADAAPATDLVNQIQVRQFDWKGDGKSVSHGFVAQELDAVFPDAVTQGETWAVDNSKLVPLLMKSLQEAWVAIEELRTSPRL